MSVTSLASAWLLTTAFALDAGACHAKGKSYPFHKRRQKLVGCLAIGLDTLVRNEAVFSVVWVPTGVGCGGKSKRHCDSEQATADHADERQPGDLSARWTHRGLLLGMPLKERRAASGEACRLCSDTPYYSQRTAPWSGKDFSRGGKN